MSGRKVTGLPLPETPREAPPEIHGLVDAIEEHYGASQVMEAVLALGRVFDYLTRYFAAVAGGATQILGLGGSCDVAVDFEAARTQLKERLDLLGDKSTDSVSKLVRSVFYVGATRKTPTPRRHSRLLDLGGIPIRGYLNLGEWIALTPGEKDLATDAKANRELLRYLPILKEWITATASFFLDAEQSELRWEGESAIVFELTLAEGTQEVGPIQLPDDLKAILSSFVRVPIVSEEPEESAPELPAEDVEPAPEPEPEPEPTGNLVALEQEPPEPKPELLSTQNVETDSEFVISEVPKIEVVQVSAEEESAEADVEQSSGPLESSIRDTEEPSSVSSEDAQQEVSEDRLEPDPSPSPQAVAESQDLPSAESELEPPAELNTNQEGESVEDSLEADAIEESPPEIPSVPVAESLPLPRKPEPDELSDPVVAALHTSSSKPKVSKEEGAREQAAVQLHPLVTGPPPEFFDEIVVEADYPEVLNVALTDLNGAIESNDSILICGQMQRCFDILIQFFAGLAGAVIAEIDEEALFDFEVEDGRFDLEVKVELLVTALSNLEEHWEANDAANLLWSVFYDTLLPATDPNCAYLHTRLLGVEGLVPEPFVELVELCRRVPGEGKLKSQALCRNVCHHYLPILAFWLENAMPLFLECEVDFVDEEKGKALSWAATVAGAFLDGTGSGFWIEISPDRWNLPRPELAPVFVSGDAPEVLLPVFDELNSALEKGEYERAGLQVRVAVDFLIQYFAGCAASLWRQQGEMNQQALALFYPDASLEEKERLLVLSLGGISTESEVGLNLGKLFSKGSLQYRALTQRVQDTDIGSLSSWASSREPVSETELMTYLPVLRSWIGAANPWFAAGEQLFEDPSKDGVLEGVVVYGDDFLEMVDPEYVIQLARECLELVAPIEEEEEEQEEILGVAETPVAETAFTGKLPQLPILSEGPPVLVGHVNRLLESAEDRRTSNAWLGSAFEYLIQYFAGLCTTVLGAGAAPISRNVLTYFNPSASLREREILLLACIEHLKTAATGKVQENVRDIFLKPDGSYREHTKNLGALGAGSLNENEMLLSYWCRVRHQAGHLTTEDLHFGTRVLTTWLEACKPFFSSCEHYAEDPGADGQEEMVVELADDYLDMVLPDYAIQIPARGYYELLYKEPDAEARADMESYFPEDVRPSLIGPQEVVLGGVADEAGDELLGAAVELGAEDMFGGAAEAYDADDLFAGSAVTQQLDVDDLFTGAAPDQSSPEPVGSDKTSDPFSQPQKSEEDVASPSPALVQDKKKKKKKKSKKQELGSAVLELYKKERLEKARKRAEARARKAEAQPTQLSFTLQYRGLKNSKQLGGRGHFGLLELKNIGGGELKGTIESEHPCVRVQPTRFEGNQVRVTYQIDPADMPSTGRNGLTINTQDERVSLRLDRLVPTSWWRERSTVQAMALMTAPSLIYGLWLLILLAGVLGPSLAEAFEFYGRSVRFDKLPWGTHLKAWMFAILAILPGATAIPALIKSMFARLDYTVQEETRWLLLPSMMLPTATMFLLMYGTSYWVFDIPSSRLPLLGSRFLITLLTFGLNLLAASLFSLQTTVWWEDHSDTEVAKRTFIGFWAATLLLGVVVTFFMW